MSKKNFEFDIFLNYSKSDTYPKDSKNSSWIQVFREYFGKVIIEMLGFEPIFTDLSQNSESSAIKINFLTENFLKDPVCFDKSSKSDFFISQSPLSLPDSLAGIYVYSFFSKKANPTGVEPFDEFYANGQSESSSFWLTLIDLSYDVRDALLKKKGLEIDTPNKGKVYLAQTTPDTSIERILVKSELQRYGYEVIPNFVPQNEFEIKQALEGCLYSIHLIGKEYGEVMPDSNISIVELENNICSHYQNTLNQLKDHKFERLVWVSPLAEDLRGRQGALLEHIKREARSENPVEVIQCRIEDFRMLLMQKLAIKPTDIDNSSSKFGSEFIYIMSDVRDEDLSFSLSSFLQEKGFSVLVLPESTKGQARQILHRKYLKDCKVALICYNSAKRTWLVSKLQDILKSQGLGYKRSIPKSVVLSVKEDNVLDVEEILRFYPKDGVKYIANNPQSAYQKLIDFLD